MVDKINSRLTDIEKNVTDLSAKVNVLECESNKNKTDNLKCSGELEQIRIEIRRANLIFINIKEETNEDLFTIIRNIITGNLGLNSEVIPIDLIFRLGRPKQNYNRPIKVKFSCEYHKQKVFNKRHMLRNLNPPIYINEDLPPLTQEKRKLLRVENKKRLDLGQNSKVVGDKIIINNITYEYDEQNQLVQSSKNRLENNLHDISIATTSSKAFLNTQQSTNASSSTMGIATLSATATAKASLSAGLSANETSVPKA